MTAILLFQRTFIFQTYPLPPDSPTDYRSHSADDDHDHYHYDDTNNNIDHHHNQQQQSSEYDHGVVNHHHNGDQSEYDHSAYQEGVEYMTGGMHGLDVGQSGDSVGSPKEFIRGGGGNNVGKNIPRYMQPKSVSTRSPMR